MKKTTIVIGSLLLITLVVSIVAISVSKQNILANKQANIAYEQYMNKELYGTDVISIINRAIDSNQKNGVQTDKQGNYVPDENSILVDIVMITDEDKEKTKTYRMETINKVGITEFISNFNTAKFRITQVKYHKQTEKISSIEITQQNE